MYHGWDGKMAFSPSVNAASASPTIVQPYANPELGRRLTRLTASAGRGGGRTRAGGRGRRRRRRRGRVGRGGRAGVGRLQWWAIATKRRTFVVPPAGRRSLVAGGGGGGRGSSRRRAGAKIDPAIQGARGPRHGTAFA